MFSSTVYSVIPLSLYSSLSLEGWPPHHCRPRDRTVVFLIWDVEDSQRNGDSRLPEFNLRFLGAFAELRKATVGFVVSLCPSAWNSLASTRQIFMKFGIWGFFEHMSRDFKFHWNMSKWGVLCVKTYSCMILSWIVLRMRNVLDKSCRGNQKSHFIFSNLYPKIVPFFR